MSYKFIFVSISILICNVVTARNYSVTLSNSTLAKPRGFMPALNDGEDVIYIVGGENVADIQVHHELLKYNITTDNIEIIAANVIPTMVGSATWDPTDQNIYYFGGSTFPGMEIQSGIWKVESNDPETLIPVGNSPTPVTMAASVWNGGDYIYTIGGLHDTSPDILDTIVRFSKTTNQSIVISRMPYSARGTSAVWDPERKVAYIFGGTGDDFVGRDGILIFNETTGVVTKLDTTLPSAQFYSCAVLIGHEVFLVGGGIWPSDMLSFIKFDLVTHEITELVIDNFPVGVSGVGCAWVETLNRIYVFGGFSFDSFYMDTIAYIDMNE